MKLLSDYPDVDCVITIHKRFRRTNKQTTYHHSKTALRTYVFRAVKKT